MDIYTKNECEVAGAGGERGALNSGNSLPKDMLGKIGAALSAHFKKYPDVFKVVYPSKLPQRDDL